MECKAISVLVLIQWGVTASQPPNIVVMIADDLGWNDVSWHNPRVVTPNLQSLADNGVILNSSYFHPKCSPSRASFLTGYYPHRLGVQRSGVGRYHAYGLNTKYKLLPEYLKEAGYKTHLVGKWHLGYCKPEYLPNHRGFDTFFGQWSHVVDYYSRKTPVKDEEDQEDHPTFKTLFNSEDNGRKVISEEDLLKRMKTGYDLHYNDDISFRHQGLFSTEMYSIEAEQIISSHDKSVPLFLMVSFQAPHSPHNKPPSQFSKHYPAEDQDRMGTVTALDAGVGRVVGALESENILDNTLILFSSDNGGNGGHGNQYNKPLKGKKEWFYEGGIRVVGVVSGAGINQPGSTFSGLTHASDWLSTLLHVAGLPHLLPQDSDSINMWPAIRDNLDSPRTRIIHNIDEDKDRNAWQAVIREGDFKLIWGSTKLLDKHHKNHKKYKGNKDKNLAVGNKLQLFNIKQDPLEKHPMDLTKHPKLVESLKEILMNEYPKATFPKYYLNSAEALPGYHDGFTVTGWC